MQRRKVVSYPHFGTTYIFYEKRLLNPWRLDR